MRPALPTAALVAATIVWGSTFVVIRGGLEGVAAFGFVALRFSLAALVLGALAARQFRRTTRHDWRSAAGVGLWLFLAYALQTLGLERSTASQGGFITALSIVLVPIGVWIWEHRRPGRRLALGVAAATAGLALLSLDETLTVQAGDLLLFGGAVAFAGHIITLGRAARVGPNPALVVGQVAVVAVLAWPAALVIEGMPRPDAPAWAAVLYTAVMATVVVLLVQSWAQRSVSANRAAVIFALEPVFAALFAVAFGGESLGTRQLAGGALIVLGMLVAVGGEEPP
ncbi:MAG: DMT family transporter [Dehalococcoidia bacterium]